METTRSYSLFKEMNAAHKLVTVIENDQRELELNYALCAHADVRAYGLAQYDAQFGYDGTIPKLFCRMKEQLACAQVKTLVQDSSGGSFVSVPIAHELGEQGTQFLVEHAPNQQNKPYFGRFFKTERSEKEKIVSMIAQTLINLIP